MIPVDTVSPAALLFKGNDRCSLFAFSRAMARVLEEIPQEMDVESTETDAMLGSTPVSQRCSRSSVGFAFLGLSMLAMVLALALPQKENRLRKSHESVIGLNDDDIWASVLSDHAMEQLHQQQAKLDDAKDKASSSAEEAFNNGASAAQKSANEMVSNLNNLLTKPKEEVKKAVNTASQAQNRYIDFDAVKKHKATRAQNPMDAVQSAADDLKKVLNLGMPQAPAPAAAAPAAPAISAPKIQLPPVATMAPAVAPAANNLMQSIGNMGTQVTSKADKMKKMADDFMQEASKAGLNPQQKAQLQSIANMLKKDAGKVGGTASAAAGSLAASAASVAAPAAPAAPAVQTVTDNPKDSPLAPQESDKSGDPCVDDEEDFGGLCYKKCSILSGGSHPCRSSAWSCCAVPDGPQCQTKSSFGNCWIHMGFCGGYSVAGDAEAASGNSCPTGEGGCLTNEEMFGNQCYKKCSLLSPQFPFRVGPSSCCSKTGGFDCFWPSNLHTDPGFNVGGGEGDENSGTPNTAHTPMLQLSQ
eukprot:s1683_g3.t1